MSVDNRLPELRKQKGWSQKELGERVGVIQGAISHIETGRKQPSLALAIRLAEELGVSLDELLGTPEANKREAVPHV